MSISLDAAISGSAVATFALTLLLQAPGTQAMYREQQTEPYREVPALNPCAQTVEYGYATHSYASGYSVQAVRPRVITATNRKFNRYCRGSAGVGAAIGVLAGGGGGFVC